MCRRAFRTIGLFGLILLACLASAGYARADSGEDAGGLAGWSPFLDAGIGVHIQEFKATGSSSIGVASSEAKVLSVLAARFGGGVRGPRWDALPGAPRLVVQGGVALPRRSSSTLQSVTETFGMLPDQDQRSTEYEVEWGTFWESSLALQYQLPIDFTEVRVTPGIAYMGTRLRYEGEFSVRTPPLPTSPPTPSMSFPIRGNASSTQHFLGPLVEIEVAFARVRRVQLSLFLDGRAYWLLGDRSERLAFEGDIDGSLETGTVRFEAKEVAGWISFGLRGAFW
jgi:hypothetical protein